MIPRTEILTHTADVPMGDGSTMGGYVARPTSPTPQAGVIVAGELFGISAHVRDVCEHLAAFGYLALAPDLYHRTAPSVELAHDLAGRERGMQLLAQLTREHALEDVRAAIEYLEAHACRRIGMVGLSLGGHIAYLAATEYDLAAVAVLYGGWISTTEIPLSRPEPPIARTGQIAARMLILVGEEDHIVPAEDREAIAAALTSAGVRHQLIEYADTPHGFLCDRRDSYRPDAACDAWQKLKAVLEDELNGSP